MAAAIYQICKHGKKVEKDESCRCRRKTACICFFVSETLTKRMTCAILSKEYKICRLTVKQKERQNMKDYEIIVESMTPCGGSKHAIRTIIEAEAESPEAYVEQNKRFPIRDISRTSDGGMVITTGNESGYIVRYTFTEE